MGLFRGKRLHIRVFKDPFILNAGKRILIANRYG